MASCMEPGNPALCALTGVEKRYGGTPVLGPVTLSLCAGEVLGIQGPNGAGKSTLLDIMAGVLTPDGGQCAYADPARGRIGYVPQELSLYSALSGLENLRFWGLACGLPAKAAAVRGRWLLEQLGLSDKAAQPVSAYSGGMKRRLHLATALMATPNLLLLDEPTVGADDASVELILAMLRRLRERGCAIAMTSHHAGELERVCTRLIKLEGGRLVSEVNVPCQD